MDAHSSPPPQCYTSLPLTTLKISHHPPSSPSPTPILVLELHRPGKHNAFTDVMAAELVQAFGWFDRDERVKVVIVTGHGRIFCVGADLSSGGRSFVRDGHAERSGDHRDGGGKVALAIHNCKKPVIAALNGSAVGVGITMTLPMAIRLAPKTAKVGFVFSRRGIIMEACSSFFLPRLIGVSRVMHLITTGSVYKADDRLLEGLFSEVLDTPELVMRRALEIAGEIAENCSTVSWALMRDLIYRGPNSAEETHLLDSRVIHGLFGTKDNVEGVESFLEKRPVRFQGTMEKDAPEAWPWWDNVDLKVKTSKL